MAHDTLLDLCKSALLTALLICTPALIIGMAVGLATSFVQTVTSMQEQTLSIVPKMLAVATALVAMLPWILGTLREYTVALFTNLAAFGASG